MVDLSPGARPTRARGLKKRKPSPPLPDAVTSTLIVGLGASAGGLNAFKEFFGAMPPKSGIGFVLIQHLDPGHLSLLADLVGRQTRMPVVEAEHGMPVLPNRVHVIPPDATLTIAGGLLQVARPAPPRQHRFPIDTFFAALAEDQSDAAACIVMSGSGSDGTAGVRAIKSHGGLTLAQSECDHLAMTGMPRSAAESGFVDHVMRVEEMPARLIEYQRQRMESGRQERSGPRPVTAETNAPHRHLFEAIDNGHQLFRRRDTATLTRLLNSRPVGDAPPPGPASSPDAAARFDDRIEQCARHVLEKHVPAYVVIDKQNKIVRSFGAAIGRYLEPVTDIAMLDLFAVLRRPLRPVVRTALDQVAATMRPAVWERVAVEAGEQTRAITVIVEPMTGDGVDPGFCMVAFKDTGLIPEYTRPLFLSETWDVAVPALEDELFRVKEQLRAAIDDAQATMDETMSSAEEYQSVNEELQSSNEELETTTEEMQSINEQLLTVNAELAGKNEMLTRLSGDKQNLLESTRIAMIFLDKDLRIKDFTPEITSIFRLRASDRGRAVTELVCQLSYDDLPSDVATVLERQTIVERDVRTSDAAMTFSMRIRPYHTVDQVADGVVITFVDITEQKQISDTLKEHAAIVEFARDALISVTLDGKIKVWNPAAERLFGYPARTAIGRDMSFLAAPDRIDELTSLIAQARNGEVSGPVETIHRARNGADIQVELTLVPVRGADDAVIALAAAIRDISGRKRAEAHRTLMMHELSHRVKNALAAVQALAMETLRTAPSLDAFRDAFVARLIALANTHGLLVAREWRDAALRDVLEAELAPYRSVGHARWTATGPDILLTPKMALAMGMAFHELATNAAKFGALTEQGGRVDIGWSNPPADGGTRLHLSWTECGGPVVAKPLRQGFGTRLISEGLGFELDGDVRIDYLPAGVRCDIDVPMDARAAAQ